MPDDTRMHRGVRVSVLTPLFHPVKPDTAKGMGSFWDERVIVSGRVPLVGGRGA